MIKGAIFDLDGTILDSMFIWSSITERFLRSCGHTPKEGLSDTINHMSMRNACEYIREEYGLPYSADEIMDKVVSGADDFYRHEAGLKPGAGELLRELDSRNIKMCIVTANVRTLAEAALERNGIDKYFQEIITCNETGFIKDEPFIFRFAAERLGLDKKDVMVFEDSVHAAVSAKKDGFHVTAIFDEHESAADELKAAADHYIYDLSEAIDYLED